MSRLPERFTLGPPEPNFLASGAMLTQLEVRDLQVGPEVEAPRLFITIVTNDASRGLVAMGEVSDERVQFIGARLQGVARVVQAAPAAVRAVLVLERAVFRDPLPPPGESIFTRDELRELSGLILAVRAALEGRS